MFARTSQLLIQHVTNSLAPLPAEDFTPNKAISMSTLPHKMRVKPNGRLNSQKGFILPMVVVAGFIIAAGIMALSTRTFAGLIGSIRLGQSREAQQAAESGLATILKELNRKYAYLLDNDCPVGDSYDPKTDCLDWVASPTNRDEICPNSSQFPTADLAKIIARDLSNEGNARSRYQLVSYKFDGIPTQGGIASIRVKGESFATLSNGSRQTRSVAVAEKRVSIVPKQGLPCEGSIKSQLPEKNKTFAGLLATRSLDFGNNIINGQLIPPNVVCTLDCYSTNPTLSNPSLLTKVSSITMPAVPQFPYSNFAGNPISLSGGVDYIIAGSSNNNKCIYESSTGITHCLIPKLELSGQAELRILSTPGESACIPNTSGKKAGSCTSVTVPSGSTGIRLYFPKTDQEICSQYNQIVCASVNISGGARISHNGTADNLALFGRPAIYGNPTPDPSQTVNFGGGAYTVNMFIYFPDGRVGISGGSSTVTSDNPSVTGAIWAKDLGCTPPLALTCTWGSRSANATWQVPDEMGGLLGTKFGPRFNLTYIRRPNSGLGTGDATEYGAVGTEKWQLFQRSL